MAKQTKPRAKIDVGKVKQLAAQGLTKEEISLALGFARGTIFNHINKYGRSDINEAIAEGRARGMAVITNKLFSLAQGGNLGAICFYLKCHGWSEKSTVDYVSSDGSMAPQPVSINISEMTPQQVAKMARAAFKGEAEEV